MWDELLGMKKSKYSDLLDSGCNLVKQLFNLGVNIGSAQASIEHLCTEKPAIPTELEVLDLLMDIIVSRIDKNYPDFLNMPQNKQDEILVAMIENIEREIK